MSGMFVCGIIIYIGYVVTDGWNEGAVVELVLVCTGRVDRSEPVGLQSIGGFKRG